jgi:ubiquinone/menaquinone biosynthesis C-methylase UbiE
MQFTRYDRIAEHYAAQWPLLVPGYVPIMNAMVDIVRAMTTPPSSILDLGCGPGTATVAVAPASHPEGKTTIVDGSRAMLKEAKHVLGGHVKRAIHGDFTNAAIAAEAMPADSYDLALVSFALHHVADAAKRDLLEPLARSLKPGALVLIADEIAIDRPGGWDVVERIRGRIVAEHIKAGRVTKEFWALEASLPANAQMPFAPARVDDLTSWMARAGLAVSCPVSVFGSALLIGVKT